MRKLLTLVFLLSFALSAQAQFPSWGRQYRPFYGKMRFMDTVAFYVRGTARPDFLLQSIDSFGRMRWADPDSLGISESTYAALSADSSDVVAVNISTTGAWTNVANIDTTYRNGGISYAPAAASITLGSAGRYRVSLSASGTGGANNYYELSVFNNGSELGFGSRLSMFSGTASAPAGDGMSTIVELAANDVLTLRIRNNTSTANWLFYSLAFNVEKL